MNDPRNNMTDVLQKVGLGLTVDFCAWYNDLASSSV